MIDIRIALRRAIAQLDAAHIDAPKTTARVLLAHVLGKPKEWLAAHDDAAIDEDAQRRFERALARVIAREPLAYVLGQREFFGLDFAVDARVLIPRPETEMLVDFALQKLSMQNAAYKIDERESLFPFPYSLLDVGTGSGAIPIAVAKHCPTARILATDVSLDALAVAARNAQRHNVAEQITFLHSDLLENVDGLPRVLTANLPYVTTEEIEGLQPEIQDHEPRVALDGGADGLHLIEKLLQQIEQRLRAHPQPLAAYLEFGASQGAAVLDLARRILPAARCEIKQDLAKLDRVLCVLM